MNKLAFILDIIDGIQARLQSATGAASSSTNIFHWVRDELEKKRSNGTKEEIEIASSFLPIMDNLENHGYDMNSLISSLEKPLVEDFIAKQVEKQCRKYGIVITNPVYEDIHKILLGIDVSRVIRSGNYNADSYAPPQWMIDKYKR
jgi:hypothetical protein